MRKPEERLLDMLEALQRIEKYDIRGRQSFVDNELIQTYVVHNLQIFGILKHPIPSNLLLSGFSWTSSLKQ